MSYKRWIINNTDCSNSELCEILGLDSVVAQIAESRGLNDCDSFESFAFADPYDFCDPFSIKDMEKATKTIYNAVANHEKITVFGDYDCDGVTSTALLYSYLRTLTDNVDYYIPDRLSEGYGMNCDAVAALCNSGTKLIITVDNGISAIEEISLANRFGMTVVVTDHHLIGDELPPAAAVVDPHRDDDKSEYSDLCGCGVAYMLVYALNVAFNGNRNETEIMKRYGALAAVGTVGDVVPLVGINRRICALGFDTAVAEMPVGLKALMTVTDCAQPITAEAVSFKLAPCINAAGRMGDSKRAVRLLLCDDDEQANVLATELLEENNKRKLLCDTVFNEAVAAIENEQLNHDRVIVVAGKNWHFGVVGIVAARICEKYLRPCILLSESDGVLHGSGRSIVGFSLFAALCHAADTTVTFGGHEMAAGVTVEKERLADFRKAICSFTDKRVLPQTVIDALPSAKEIGIGLFDELSVFEPYGAGNPKPVFAMLGAVIDRIHSLKNGKFVKLELLYEDMPFKALVFKEGIRNFPFVSGDRVDIAYYLSADSYNEGEVVLSVVDYRPSDLADEKYFSSLNAYENFCEGTASPDEAAELLPTRDDFVAVYTYLCERTAKKTVDGAVAHIKNLSAGKISVIADSLLQLGLVTEEDGVFTAVKGAKKTSVDEAPSVKKLQSIRMASVIE